MICQKSSWFLVTEWMFGTIFKVLLTGDWQYVRYRSWFYGLTCLQDAVNEVVTRNSSVVVCIHLAEEVGHSGLLVVHELHKLWEGNGGY